MPSPVIPTDIELVRRAVKGPLPGTATQQAMAPRPPTPVPQPPRCYRDAGVLLLVYPCDGAVHLALTRRCAHLTAHAGQISLPGGLREEHDASFAETALRETGEELGLDRAGIELLGALTPIDIALSGYRIHPWVACAAGRPAFRPDPGEVAELVEVPLALLLDPTTATEERWTIRGNETQVPFYLLAGHKVWGATAMVLSEFAALLRLAGGCAKALE